MSRGRGVSCSTEIVNNNEPIDEAMQEVNNEVVEAQNIMQGDEVMQEVNTDEWVDVAMAADVDPHSDEEERDGSDLSRWA